MLTSCDIYSLYPWFTEVNFTFELVDCVGGGGALGYFLGGYVPPGTPNGHPVLKKISSKIDTPF